MTVATLPAAFEGIYDPPEAATFLAATLRRDFPDATKTLSVTSGSVLRWIRGGFADPSLTSTRGYEMVLSFEDLISMRVVGILRSLGVTWQKIHSAEEWLRKETNYRRPFAVKRVWTETADVFAEFSPGLVTASRQGQLAFLGLVEQYLKPVGDMTFKEIMTLPKLQVAADWSPHSDVLIHPEVHFGAPCVRGTRVLTRSLWRMTNGGESTDRLMGMFGLTKEQIENALGWERRLAAVKKP